MIDRTEYFKSLIFRVFGDLKKKTAEKPKPAEPEERQENGAVVVEPEASEAPAELAISEVLPNGEETVSESVAVVAEPVVAEQTNSSMANELESQKFDSVKEIEKICTVSKSEELKDLMTWLHDQPPLTEEYLRGLFIEHRDFESALTVVQPSSKREGFATVPDVTWNDIGSLQNIRQELQMSILAPVRHSEKCAELGLTSATGVLLCGPPGCGKTLLAKAIANEAGINFISVKGPELLNMVGVFLFFFF